MLPGCNGWLALLKVARVCMEFVAIVWQWLCACLRRSRTGERSLWQPVVAKPTADLTAQQLLQRRLVELRDLAVCVWITAVGWWIPGKQSLLPLQARTAAPHAGNHYRRKPRWS